MGGAQFSQALESDLRRSTLKELLSDKKFVGRLQEAAPALDDNVREDLRKLLTHRATKRRFKRKKRPGSESREDSSFQDATIGASAHENVLQEAAAAGTNPNASGAAIALSTTVLPTTSDIA